MKTYHVGGLNPIRRFKTLAEALKAADSDDIIELHKNINEATTADKFITIHGNGHTNTVPFGKVGIYAQKAIEITNMKFVVSSRSTAIQTTSDIVLDDVTVDIEGPITEFYHAVLIMPKTNDKNEVTSTTNYTIENSHLKKLTTGYGTKGKIHDTVFSTYYEGDIMLSSREDMSYINGTAEFKNCTLRSIVLAGQATVDKSEIQKYVDIDGDVRLINPVFNTVHETVKPNRYKKEPKRGPLESKTDNLYAIAIRPEGKLTLDGYTVETVDEDFVAIYGDKATVAVQNVNNKDQNVRHVINNSTVSFKEVHDGNFWELNNSTTAYVRSDVQSNNKHVTAKEKLDGLIGQQEVKNQVNSIMNTIEMNRNSKDKNFAFSYNMIFAGSPGTGKTTIAKIVAEALFEVGAIPENKFTEATSDTFVKGYVGQTGENTRKILEGALGGVLFIDEAYELAVKDDGSTFNSEVISTLIRFMEEHRSDLVVIAAGYNKEMKDFLASNIGLDRRFQWIQFEDYTNHEMAEIFEMVRKSYGDEYQTPGLQAIIEPLFTKLTTLNLSIPDTKGRVTNGGNGGLVRNVYQQIVQARNNRVVGSNADPRFTKEDIAIGFKSELMKAERRRV